MVYAFSDGSPIAEYLIFLTVLFSSLILFLPHAVLSKADRALAKLAGFARARRALPEQGLVPDLRRIDVFRIIVGAMATCRYGKMLFVSLAAQDATTILLAGTATLLAIFVMIGFLTPASVFLLMSTSNILFDNYLGASTLGTMVMSICLMVVLLAPGGLTLSLDTALANSRPISSVIAWLRRISGPAHADRIIIAKLCGLFAYFSVCLYSVSWHFLDEAWTSGLVIAWVMLSPIANPEFFPQMWDAYNLVPWLFVGIARLSMAGMFAWYVLTLPGIFMGRWVRLFIIVWGLLFFLISAFVLPLSYLGWYELAFWFVLFAQGKAFGSTSGPDLAILFDDRCNLCDTTVKTLARLDVFCRVEFRPIRRNIEFANNHGVSLQQGLTDLVGVDLSNGNRVSGFDLYYTLTGRLVLLWPLRPVFWLARLTKIGPKLYRFIADRRTKLFGVCEFSNIPDRYFRSVVTPDENAERRTTPFTAGLVFTLAVLGASFLLRLPIGSTEPETRPVANFSRSLFGASPAAFGIHKINVFNSQDLAVFRFTNELFLYHDGFDLRSSETTIASDSKRIEKVMSDQQSYLLTSHMRRMSRMNFGCDREFIESTLPIWRDTLRLPNGETPVEDVIIEFRISAWPTADDLRAYATMQRESWPLCRFRVNLKDQSISDFVFIQEGLNESVRQKGYPPVLEANHAEAAIDFPCQYAAAFSNLIAKPQTNSENSSEFATKLSKLGEDRFGRFGADCFLETWQLLHQWPDSFPENHFALIDPGSCGLGLELLRRLNNSLPVNAEPNPSINAHLQKGETAAAAGDSLQCLQESRAGWDSYWNEALLSGQVMPLTSTSATAKNQEVRSLIAP
ncbi:thiol-disulfide oxidoreductase DCC family protein [Hyphomicrobiales bacterium]|uniref:thiol-disulfide oxidoreductase DCC family protein n=1 Tax=Agrobacterium radiobacter TaxID=362 RepID=UPI0013AF37E5